MRLKQEYVRKQQEVFQVNSSEVITFGEISLVKELKIANDNLRWRLEQKNLLLQKNKEIITNAALQLKVVEEKNKELEKKNISLSLQVQQFKQQVQQLQQQQQQKQQQQGSSSTLLTSDSDETNHNGQQGQQENSASAEEGRGVSDHWGVVLCTNIVFFFNCRRLEFERESYQQMCNDKNMCFYHTHYQIYSFFQSSYPFISLYSV